MFDTLSLKPYVAHQKLFDPAVPHGRHYYWKSHKLGPLTDDIIDVIVEHAGRITSPLATVPIFTQGGAVARVAEDETAFPNRDAAHNINIVAAWMPTTLTRTVTSTGSAGSSRRWSPTAGASM